MYICIKGLRGLLVFIPSTNANTALAVSPLTLCVASHNERRVGLSHRRLGGPAAEHPCLQGAQRIAGKAGQVAGRVVAVARGRSGSSYGVVGTRDTDTALV